MFFPSYLLKKNKMDLVLGQSQCEGGELKF